MNRWMPRALRDRRGSALFVTVLMLVLMGGIGFAALEAVTRDQQVAGYHKRARSAFYAAEAGAAVARNLVRNQNTRAATPALAQTDLADATTYPYGQPSFQADPAVNPAIRWVRDGAVVAGGNLRIGGRQLVDTYWQANVMGRATGGATTRIEFGARQVLAKGS